MWGYMSTFFGVELVFAVDEVIISRAFYADIMTALEFQEMTAVVFAGETFVHRWIRSRDARLIYLYIIFKP